MALARSLPLRLDVRVDVEDLRGGLLPFCISAAGAGAHAGPMQLASLKLANMSRTVVLNASILPVPLSMTPSKASLSSGLKHLAALASKVANAPNAESKGDASVLSPSALMDSCVMRSRAPPMYT